MYIDINIDYHIYVHAHNKHIGPQKRSNKSRKE